LFHTYTITDFVGAAIPHFHINRLEDMPPLPPHIKSPHKHLFYEVLLVQHGTMQHNVDYQEFDIGAHTLFFISQGQLHFWGKTDVGSMSGYRLMFTEDFFLLNHIDKSFLFELVFLDNIYFKPCLSLNETSIKPIHHFFELLHQEYQRTTPNVRVLQSLLYLTLTEIQRVVGPQSPPDTINRGIATYKQFVELMELNLSKHWSVSYYAEQLNISPKQLNKMVQTVSGQSVNAVIQARVLLEAKRYLTCTDLNVNQISEQLGFGDSAYFARFFRKESQQSPTEFRQQLAEMYRKKA
jgi:AraC family transcriptional regulator, transcriptional activator of pobA